MATLFGSVSMVVVRSVVFMGNGWRQYLFRVRTVFLYMFMSGWLNYQNGDFYDKGQLFKVSVHCQH